jgi:hypothetical protein
VCLLSLHSTWVSPVLVAAGTRMSRMSPLVLVEFISIQFQDGVALAKIADGHDRPVLTEFNRIAHTPALD